MSVSVTVRISGNTAPGFLVSAAVAPGRMAALNRVLGERLAEELRGHFTERNAEPNRMKAPKTNFWQDVARATNVISADADGAVVGVAEERFRIHFYGGTIVPKTAKFLTIPLIPEARGKFARDYERTSGRKLFLAKNVLMERVEGETTGERGTGRRTPGATRIKTNRPRAVYLLVKKATIRRDEKAIPPLDELAAALAEEAEDFLARDKRRGGRA